MGVFVGHEWHTHTMILKNLRHCVIAPCSQENPKRQRNNWARTTECLPPYLLLTTSNNRSSTYRVSCLRKSQRTCTTHQVTSSHPSSTNVLKGKAEIGLFNGQNTSSSAGPLMLFNRYLRLLKFLEKVHMGLAEIDSLEKQQCKGKHLYATIVLSK